MPTVYGKDLNSARITFIAKDDDTAQTYIGKLKKGDITNLKYELQRYNSGTANTLDVDDEKNAMKGYVERIAVVGEKKKNKKRLNEATRNDLIGNYEVKDEEALKEVKEKKQKAAEKKASTKDDSGNYLKYQNQRKRGNTPQLSKYFSISEKKIRNGYTFTKPFGSVAFIVTYKIREGKNINTYINVVEGYLKPGSDYYLRYHGNGSKRLYYLEYVSTAKLKAD
jgi:hypothetical protein